MVAGSFIADLLIFLVSAIILGKSGAIVVKSLVKVASSLKMKEFVVGFILMAFFTTLPELLVGITSAIRGIPDLALGTVIGSNIVNLTLIIGIAAVLGRGITVQSGVVKKSTIFMVGIATIPILLMLIGNGLSRIDGVFLIILFLFYMYILVKFQWHFTELLNHDEKKMFVQERKRKVSNEQIVKLIGALFTNFLVFLFGVGLLFLSSWFVTEYAFKLSVHLSMPQIMVGLFMVALGTSLPELTFTIKSVLSKHAQMALGDIVGAVIINSTLVLGITALIAPFKTGLFLFLTSAVFMIVIMFLFMALINSKSGIDWRVGMALIFLYAFFIILEFVLKSLPGI